MQHNTSETENTNQMCSEHTIMVIHSIQLFSARICLHISKIVLTVPDFEWRKKKKKTERDEKRRKRLQLNMMAIPSKLKSILNTQCYAQLKVSNKC